MPVVTIKDLVEAGVHFGTKTSRWNPKMKPYIYGSRNQIHIVDLRATVRQLIEAHYYVAKLAKSNKQILFVGTKRQAKDVIREAARSIGMPFVAERWLGGTLTNFDTIRTSVRRLDDIEKNMSTPEYIREPKKVQARDGRERRRILRNLEGVRTMNKLPDALFVIDPTTEATAVAEARRLDIPVIALLDSDCDPEQINLPIPGNDDGIRSIQAVVKVILEGWARGKYDQTQRTGSEKAEEATAAATAG
jgi:small subunit ribosomal protein S2